MTRSQKSKRDVERRLDALEADDDSGDGEPQEVPDLSLSMGEKEALDEAFDVDPEMMKQA